MKKHREALFIDYCLLLRAKSLNGSEMQTQGSYAQLYSASDIWSDRALLKCNFLPSKQARIPSLLWLLYLVYWLWGAYFQRCASRPTQIGSVCLFPANANPHARTHTQNIPRHIFCIKEKCYSSVSLYLSVSWWCVLSLKNNLCSVKSKTKKSYINCPYSSMQYKTGLSFVVIYQRNVTFIWPSALSKIALKLI